VNVPSAALLDLPYMQGIDSMTNTVVFCPCVLDKDTEGEIFRSVAEIDYLLCWGSVSVCPADRSHTDDESANFFAGSSRCLNFSSSRVGAATRNTLAFFRGRRKRTRHRVCPSRRA